MALLIAMAPAAGVPAGPAAPTTVMTTTETPPPDAPTARHARLTALFDELSDVPVDVQERQLAALAADDPDLAARVRALLDADRSTSSLLDQDANVLAAHLAGPEPAAPLPRRFGHYAITGYIGEGGMGTVYLARRDGLEDLVAVKFLRDPWSPAARERFAREQRTLASLNHAAIARLYDAGVADDRPWFAMEHVDGQNVIEHAAARHLDLPARLSLFRAACEAVSFAHRNLVVHLDLKPSNILVTARGDVKLVDFGVSRLLDGAGDTLDRTATGYRRLSMNYASPEQIRGEALDVQSDVHGLGAVLYELLAGQPPVDFAPLTPLELTRALTSPPPRPSQRAAGHPDTSVRASHAQWRDLDAICLRALHRDKDERYASVESLLADLTRFERSEPLDARTTGRRADRVRKFLTRHRRPLLVTAAVAAGVAAIVVGFTLRLVAARDAAIASRAQLERIHGLMLNIFDGDDDVAGPSGGLRVAALLDRGVQGANALDADPVLQAELRSTFGGLYHKLGRVDRAGPLLVAALETQRQRLGAAHADTLRTQLALATLRVEEAEHEEAERLARDAFRLASSRPSRDPMEVATARAMVGRVLVDRGRYTEAEAELSGAVAELEKYPPSAALSEAVGQLANAAYYRGDLAATSALNTRALALDRALFGPRHPHVSIDLFNLGNLALDRGDYTAAEALYRDALAINEEWYGPDHQRTAQTVLMHGRSLAYQGRFDEARDLYERARTVFARTYGERHLRVGVVLSLLGDLERNENRLDAAEAAFREAQAILLDIFGAQHEFSLHQRSNVASVHLARQEFAAAEGILREVVSGMLATVPRQRYTAIAQYRLARALAGQARWAEARAQASLAHELLTTQLGPQAQELIEARQLLDELAARVNETERGPSAPPKGATTPPAP